MPRLTGLALARHSLDRVTERRSDPGYVDALWSDPRARLLVLVDDAAPLAGDSLHYVSTADFSRTEENLLLGLDEDGAPYFAIAKMSDSAIAKMSDGVQSSAEADLSNGTRLAGLREAGALLGDRDAGAFVHALALANWHATHGFCAKCGRPTVIGDGGHVRRCPACEAIHFPRTDPAIIVLITDDDDRVLLGRGANWPEGRFSTIAGFVEPGESLENAVVREVHEETGVHVVDPSYAGSQPWPFPSSLMLGFFARAVSTEINVDGVEMAEARWFSHEELGNAYRTGELLSPSGVSIARRLIETWYGEAL